MKAETVNARARTCVRAVIKFPDDENPIIARCRSELQRSPIPRTASTWCRGRGATPWRLWYGTSGSETTARPNWRRSCSFYRSSPDAAPGNWPRSCSRRSSATRTWRELSRPCDKSLATIEIHLADNRTPSESAPWILIVHRESSRMCI